MSNFNEYFKSRGCQTIVRRFFSSADMYNPKGIKITDLNFVIEEEPPQPASYYIENGLTATHKVKLIYHTTEDDTEKYSSFEIPKEIDGAFIIEGAYRIATNKLGSDYDCRIKMSVSSGFRINFDFDRYYDIKKQVLKIKKINPDLGIGEKTAEIKYKDLNTVTGERKELLRLTDTQAKKFEIKLDLPYRPEYITSELIDACIEFGDDRAKDLIIDKEIESVPKGFETFLFRSNSGRNYYSCRQQITRYFTQHSILHPNGINSITNLATRYFKGTSESDGDGPQVPLGVNAISLEAVGTKITIPDTVAYNTSMADLIDFADTPINYLSRIISLNAGRVNKLNQQYDQLLN